MDLGRERHFPPEEEAGNSFPLNFHRSPTSRSRVKDAKEAAPMRHRLFIFAIIRIIRHAT